jgi:hypothetical protein
MKARVTFDVIGPITEQALRGWAEHCVREMEDATGHDVEIDDITIDVVTP